MSKDYSRLFSEYFVTVHDDSAATTILNGTTRKRFEVGITQGVRAKQPGDLDEYLKTHRNTRTVSSIQERACSNPKNKGKSRPIL
jgi:hypothetical protein